MKTHNEPNVIIKTPRLLLKRPEMKDWRKMKSILNDLKTMQYLRYMTISQKSWNRQKVESRIARHLKLTENGEGCLYHLFFGEKLIGSAGFQDVDNKKKEASFGLIIDHSWWDQGFATEVHLFLLEYGIFQLNLAQVFFKTTLENVRMQNFFRKFSIPLTSLIKNDVTNLDGQPQDQLVYTITSEQWPQTKKLLETALSSFLYKSIKKFPEYRSFFINRY